MLRAFLCTTTERKPHQVNFGYLYTILSELTSQPNKLIIKAKPILFFFLNFFLNV